MAGSSRTAARVDPERMRADIDALASFGTRHTLSDTQHPARGIGAARAWIHKQLADVSNERVRRGLPPLNFSLDTHRVNAGERRIDRDVDIANVVAVMPGRLEAAGAAERIYISGHYDSRNGDEMDRAGDAPGANDDASGVSVMLESARALCPQAFDHTIVFVAFDAEEAGLYGARRHVAALAEQGARVRAVLNHDIVGDPTAPDGSRDDRHIRVFSEGLPAFAAPPAPAPGAADDVRGRSASVMMLERLRREGALGDSGSRQLARYIEEVATRASAHVRPVLVFRADRFLRGGDHTPFHEAGFAAVRFTEMAEDYDRQHQNVGTRDGRRFGDLPEFVDERYLAGVARLNVLVAAALADAPTAPPEARIIAAELSRDTLIRWSPSPDPDVAGYQIVWRETTSPRWQHSLDAGSVLEARVPVSKDDVFFGVRAYDRDGHESLVSFCLAARE